MTVWNEYRHERNDAAVAAVYPQGIHAAIAEGLKKEPDMTVRTATLDEPEHGLTAAVLESTDVLIWWGHIAHEEVSDAVAARVQQRVHQGMGLVVLHSGHMSKPFTRLMGTSCLLRWREAGEKERLWVVEPGHPIADGLSPYFEIAHEEMYGERFDDPLPRSHRAHQLVRRGQRVPLRLLLDAGQGKDLLLQARARDFPDLPAEGGPAGDPQRGALGIARRRAGHEAG